MAEFDGLDSRLREALGQAAEPGDSAGVADAIRSRVAAGDAGYSVAGATAPGWGGGLFSWLPWVGLIVLAGVVGGAVGATGLVGTPAPQAVTVLQVDAVIPQAAPAYACPGGPQVGELHGGDRVVAVQRSADGGYLGVRDPRNVTTVLWLDAPAVVVDEGEADVATLPVGACPEVAIAYPQPKPTQGPGPQPTQEPGPAPGPSDTTAPQITQWWVTPDQVVYEDFPADNSATLHVLASDNVGVVGVDVSWSGTHSGSATMSFASGDWRYTYVVPPGTPEGSVVFTMRARDAAGNLSAPVTLNVITSSAPE